MHNRPEASNSHSGSDLPAREHAAASGSNRPLADREVPLPGTMGASMSATHQWLDGQLSEAEARRANPKHVALWASIAGETDRRRRMTTPSHVAAQIMAALPPRSGEA